MKKSILMWFFLYAYGHATLIACYLVTVALFIISYTTMFRVTITTNTFCEFWPEIAALVTGGISFLVTKIWRPIPPRV